MTPITIRHPVGYLGLSIHDAAALTTREAQEIDRLWLAARETTPRLFDGPMLVLHEDRVLRGSLAARRATYKHLVGAAAIAQPVRALGVQGLVTARDAVDIEHVLLGRRSSETRIYGGMWENAPSGTLHARPDARNLTGREIIGVLAEEGLEELGIDLTKLSDDAVTWVAMLEDATACSDDFLLRIDLGKGVEMRRLPCVINAGEQWEYIDAAWIAVNQLQEFVATAQARGAISPPTVELFRWLGWINISESVL